MSDAMAAQVLSGLIFFGFVYYVMYIPLRNKKLGVETPKLVERVKRDLIALGAKIKAAFNLFKK
jgi:hypothetical protein